MMPLFLVAPADNRFWSLPAPARFLEPCLVNKEFNIFAKTAFYPKNTSVLQNIMRGLTPGLALRWPN
jgi:hypothetical protein